MLRGERPGVLSRPFEGLPEAHRRRVVDALVELPAEIELVSLRHLGPAIRPAARAELAEPARR